MAVVTESFDFKSREQFQRRQSVIDKIIASAGNISSTELAETLKDTADELNTYKAVPNQMGGSSAPDLEPTSTGAGGAGGVIDIVRNYPWTLTNVQRRSKLDIPYVILKEYKLNESAIKAQMDFYLSAFTGAAGATAGVKQATTRPYDELYSRENPTPWSYIFPFFGKTNMELNTQPWTSPDFIDKATNATKGFLEDIGKSNTFKGTKLGNVATAIPGIAGFASSAIGFGASLAYPVVGNFDRPKLFSGHNASSLTITFPLFNTVTNTIKIGDQLIDRRPVWEKNRDFLFLFMNQNLFNKRDFITGESPVFYEVYIPGQFFCPACAVTSFKVENEGNSRIMMTSEQLECIVPDVYNITITLDSLVMPSKNLFQALDTGEARSRVFVTGGDVIRSGVSNAEIRTGVVQTGSRRSS